MRAFVVRTAAAQGRPPPFAAFFSSASSMTACATCCIDMRRSMEVFWIQRNAAGSLSPYCVCSTDLARSTSLRVSRRWLRSATSRSSSFSSVNRETAISIAGTTSLLLNGLTRYAIAPASRARSTRSRCEKAVSISTGAMDSSAIFSAAEMPSSLGIFTSRITRSGRCSRASSTACSPSPASPTTVYPSSSSISLRSSRISASSSAMTTRVVIGGTCDLSSSGTSAGWGDSGALNVGSLVRGRPVLLLVQPT